MHSRNFNRIFTYALESNVEGLKEIIKENIALDFPKGAFTPVVLLAKKGEHIAVDLLVHEFGVNIDNAAFGYAIANNQEKIQEMLRFGASRSSIIKGLAFGNHQEELKVFFQTDKDSYSDVLIGAAMGDHVTPDMLKNRKDYEGIIEGYAISKNTCEVNQIIKTQGKSKQLIIRALAGFIKGKHENVYYEFVYDHRDLIDQMGLRDFALSGQSHVACKKAGPQPLQIFITYTAALNGNTGEVNAFLKPLITKAAVSPIWAFKGYIIGGHIAQAEKLLEEQPKLLASINSLLLSKLTCWRLLPFIKNPELQLFLSEKILKNSDHKNLAERSKLIRHFMDRYDLSFAQSVELLTSGFHSWLTVGFSLVTSKNFPFDLFLLVATQIVDLAKSEIKEITYKIQLKLHNSAFIQALKFFNSNENKITTTNTTNNETLKKTNYERTSEKIITSHINKLCLQ